MLGVKTSLKDRWRQILAEAKRITKKHLITLQPGISENQTAEMHEQGLQLVVPTPILPTYTAKQQQHIIGLGDFIEQLAQK